MRTPDPVLRQAGFREDKVMKKRAPLKLRGVRLSIEQWEALQTEAAKDESGRTRPSDVVRWAIDDYILRAER